MASKLLRFFVKVIQGETVNGLKKIRFISSVVKIKSSLKSRKWTIVIKRLFLGIKCHYLKNAWKFDDLLNVELSSQLFSPICYIESGSMIEKLVIRIKTDFLSSLEFYSFLKIPQ